MHVRRFINPGINPGVSDTAQMNAVFFDNIKLINQNKYEIPMKKISLIVVLISLTILCSNGVSQTETTKADENYSAVINILKETVKEHNVPGAALLIKFDDGSTIKEAYGYAKIQKDDSVKMNTQKQFRIGSLTKTIVGTAVLILVKEGKLNLSDEVNDLLPNTIKYGDGITLEMLLNQSSSIMNYTTLDSFADIYYYQPNYSWTHKAIVDLFKDEELDDTPGKLSYYSNSNYYLLGMIVEKYSGQPLDQFLAEKIFQPLGMSNSYFPTEDDLHGDYCHGYFDVNQDGNFTEDEDYSSQSPIAIWAAGGVVSTLDDLDKWINELLSGTLLNEELQAKRENINMQMAGAPEGVNYGLAIANMFGAVGHNGAVAGYNTILFKYNNTTFIAFGNGYETTGERGLIAEDLFENLKTALFE